MIVFDAIGGGGGGGDSQVDDHRREAAMRTLHTSTHEMADARGQGCGECRE